MTENMTRDPDEELAGLLRASLATATLDVPLAETTRRGRRLQVRRRFARIGSGVAVAAAAAIAVPLLSGSAATGPGTAAGNGVRLAAWTVSLKPDGLVIVQVNQLKDPAGLQRALRAQGVPAAVRFQAAGKMSLTPPLPRECADTGLSDKASGLLQEKILPDPMVPGSEHKITGYTILNGHKTKETSTSGESEYPPSDLIIRPSAIPAGIGLNITVDWAPNSSGWSLGLVKATPACTG